MLPISKWEQLTPMARRSSICELEEHCKSLPQATLPLNETFCNGIYARELIIPQGVTLVGEIHLQENLNIVTKGKILVATEEGVKEISAPAMFKSPAGTKRAGHTLEETHWICLHATHLTDTEEIKKEFIAPNFAEFDKLVEYKV